MPPELSAKDAWCSLRVRRQPSMGRWRGERPRSILLFMIVFAPCLPNAAAATSIHYPTTPVNQRRDYFRTKRSRLGPWLGANKSTPSTSPPSSATPFAQLPEVKAWLGLSHVHVRHEEPIRHALLEVPDHCRIGSRDITPREAAGCPRSLAHPAAR